MKSKPAKFGYKLWVTASLLKYVIHFCPYMGIYDFLDADLGLEGSVFDKTCRIKLSYPNW